MKFTFTKNFYCRLIGFILFSLLISHQANAQGTGSFGTLGLFQNEQILGNVGIGTLSPGQALDVQGTVRALGLSLPNLCSPVTAVSSFTCSGLSPGVRYKLILNLTQNTTEGEMTVTFNSDSGPNYYFQDLIAYTNSGVGHVLADAYQSGIDYIWLGESAPLEVGGWVQAQILFQTTTGNNDNVIFNESDVFYNGNQSVYILTWQGGVYKGSSPLSSITVTTAAGTVTGTPILEQDT